MYISHLPIASRQTQSGSLSAMADEIVIRPLTRCMHRGWTTTLIGNGFELSFSRLLQFHPSTLKQLLYRPSFASLFGRKIQTMGSTSDLQKVNQHRRRSVRRTNSRVIPPQSSVVTVICVWTGAASEYGRQQLFKRPRSPVHSSCNTDLNRAVYPRQANETRHGMLDLSAR